MQILAYLSLFVYFSFYLFEGPIRYVFNMLGLDLLIFIRDVILIFPLLFLILFKQFLLKKINISFYIFILIVTIHGIVIFLNFKNFFVVLYCTKLLITGLVGALLAQQIIQPHVNALKVILVFWLITFFAIFLDKYFIEYPWTGIGTTIGDIQVEVGKSWDISGAEKRAGGLMRSSINAALITPLLSLVLLFNLSSLRMRIAVFVMTTIMLYWTTQKASIIAFILTCMLTIIAYKRPIPMLKTGISLAFILMIALPTILPQYEMPTGKGAFSVFSLGSFYMRADEVWPKAWIWIERHSVFPFGVGLGGIGGAMRFYAPEHVNYADNMFLFLYAYFGIFCFLYMGWLWLTCMRAKNDDSDSTVIAFCIISFLIFYGSAMTIIEDQMGSLFLGAAISWIASNNAKRARINAANQ